MVFEGGCDVVLALYSFAMCGVNMRRRHCRMWAWKVALKVESRSVGVWISLQGIRGIRPVLAGALLHSSRRRKVCALSIAPCQVGSHCRCCSMSKSQGWSETLYEKRQERGVRGRLEAS